MMIFKLYESKEKCRAKRFHDTTEIYLSRFSDLFVEDGIKKIVPFETDILDGLDKEIKGAWCVVVDCDGIPHTEVMSMEMIQKSWDFPKKKTFKE